MSTLRLLKFGDDRCFRVEILRKAGYEVHHCDSLPTMQRLLQHGPAMDLICIAEGWGKHFEKAAALAREVSDAPVVLFRDSVLPHAISKYDLEVWPLTPPTRWLSLLENLATGGRPLNHRSQLPIGNAALPSVISVGM